MNNSIVVVGMSCIFPGIEDLTGFWKSVVNHINISQMVDERCLHGAEPAGQAETSYILRINDVDAHRAFDTAKAGITADDLSSSDGLKALVASQVSSALLDAGVELDDLAARRVHFIIVHNTELRGPSGTDKSAATIDVANLLKGSIHTVLNLGFPPANPPHQKTEPISNIEILEGDEVRVFEGIKKGISHLNNNACDLFVLSAITLHPSGETTCMVGNPDGHLPETSYGKDFNAIVGSFLKSEGAAAIVLARDDDLGAYRNESYATVRSVSIEPKDAAAGFPRLDTSRSVFRNPSGECGISSQEIGFLEVQGRALSEDRLRGLGPFNTNFVDGSAVWPACPVESVKSIIGEAGTAAGLASFIKAVLCLKDKIIAGDPQPVFDRVDISQRPFYPNEETRPWIHHKSHTPRRAAVTVLGSNGKNAHTILEESTERQENVQARAIKLDLKRETELLVFSADSPQGINNSVKQLRSLLQQRGGDICIEDVARTQTEIFSWDEPCRLALVCRDFAHLDRLLGECSTRLEAGDPDFKDIEEIYFKPPSLNKPGKIAFIFPGLLPGRDGPNFEIVKELCLHYPEVRHVFDYVDLGADDRNNSVPTHQVFFPPSYLTTREREELRRRLAPPIADRDEQDDFSYGNNLPIFAVAVVNHAIYNLLKGLNAPVDMMYGFCLGELNALCCAGSLSFDSVMPLFWQISVDNLRLANSGRLAFAVCSEDQLKAVFGKVQNVEIAYHITRELQILGGETSQLEKALQLLRDEGIWTQSLPYPAIHTSYFTDLKMETLQLLEKISIDLPKNSVYTGINSQIYPNDLNEIRKTLLSIFDHPIMFWQTVENMYRDGARIFLQIGLGNNLNTQVKSIIRKNDVLSLSMHSDHHSAITQLNHLCAQLLAAGLSLDLSLLFKYRHTQILDYDLKSNCKDQPEVSHPNRIGLDESESKRQEDKFSENDEKKSSRSPDRNARMPFLGKVVQYLPGQEITVQYQLDLKEDLYLKHHLFVYAPKKPDSACSPIVPLTFGMEIMAEVAACLAPGCGLIGFERLKAHKWIDLKDSEMHSLTISARFIDEDATLLTRRLKVDIFKEGETSPATSCVAVYGKRYLLSLQLQFEEMKGFHRFPMTPEQIYGERHLFHGPLLRGITKIVGTGDRNIIGEITMPTSKGMFRSLRNPEFVFAPAVFDAVAQLVGVWAMETKFRALPIGIEKLELYQPAPPPGTRLPVSIQITGVSQRVLHADIEIQDGAGAVWGRIRKWSFWIFHWPQKAIDFIRMPPEYFLSSEKPLSFIPTGAICRHVSEADIYDLDVTLIARICLHLAEMPRFFELDRSPRRQRQWLLGRIAAKEAISSALKREKPGISIHPAEIILGYNGNRRPVLESLEDLAQSLNISISHAENRAVAIVHTEPIGIDLELIKDRKAGFLDAFTTAEERSMLSELGSTENPALITRLWCAKEAAAKAKGTDMGGNPHVFQAIHIQDDGKILLAHRQSNLQYIVYTHRDDDFILAVASVL